MLTYLCVAESLCYSPETITTFLIGYQKTVAELHGDGSQSPGRAMIDACPCRE